MTDVQKAMLGDKEAAERLTESGELLPCPFCGNDKNIISNWGMWRCWCPNCLAKSEDTLKQHDAIKAWNTRSQLLTKEQIEALERMEDNGHN